MMAVGLNVSGAFTQPASMSLLDYLPGSSDYKVRQQVDEIFSREMLGAVIVGKFVGDYVAYLSTSLIGAHLGLLLGVFMSISLFIYWHKLEQKVKEKKDEISSGQTTMDDWKEDREDREDQSRGGRDG